MEIALYPNDKEYFAKLARKNHLRGGLSDLARIGCLALSLDYARWMNGYDPKLFPNWEGYDRYEKTRKKLGYRLTERTTILLDKRQYASFTTFANLTDSSYSKVIRYAMWTAALDMDDDLFGSMCHDGGNTNDHK